MCKKKESSRTSIALSEMNRGVLIEIQNQTSFERFMQLLAGRVGQLVNLHALSNDVGVSSVTLSKWLSVLESSFIVFRWPHKNQRRLSENLGSIAS